MRKFLKKKNILRKAIIPIIFLAIFIIPIAVSAVDDTSSTESSPTTNIIDIDTSQVLSATNVFEKETKETTGIAYLIGAAAGWILSFFVDLVNFAINLGNNVLNIPAVTTGWGIVLQFANLGFVLAIIVMAFATIFQQQSYAMKNTLWKLIVAALLVNFSLVIAGGFISVSTLVSSVFLKAINNDLGHALGKAMEPQNLLEISDISGWSIFTGLLSALIKFFISLIFVVIFTILMIFAMLTLFVMLLYRAIALIFLLILAPLAWLAWIFPSTSKYWSKWWSEFLRWNFFAPIVLFFIYLAMAIAEDINNLKLYDNTSGAAKAAAAGVILKSSTLEHAANLLVILGMLFGGIYIANKLGIEGGELGIKWAKNTGKKAKDYAGRKSKQFGSAPFRAAPFRAKIWKDDEGKRTKSTGEWLTEKAKNMGWLGRQTIGRLAQGAAKIENKGAKDTMKHFDDVAGKMSVPELQAALLTATGTKLTAVLKELQKKDKLPKDIDRYLTSSERAKWERLGQGKEFGDLEKKVGRNVEMVEANKAGNNVEFSKAAEKHYGEYKLADWQKIDPKLFTDENYGHLATQYMLTDYPEALGKIASKVKKADWDKFSETINNEMEYVLKLGDLSENIKGKIKKSVDKNLGGRFTGWGAEEKKEEKPPKEDKKDKE